MCNVIYILFLNEPENVITKYKYIEKVNTKPLIQTQIESINKKILADVNWLNKAIWPLNKTLKSVLLCKISFQKV